MAIFRKVHNEFWRDTKVLEELTPECKLFFLYLLTNPNTTQIGISKLTKKQMAFELGYSQETINSLLDLFENKYKLIRYNTETREIAIRKWGKYNLDRGGKPMIDCVVKELKEVKDISLVKYISENIAKDEIKEIFKDYVKLKDHTYNDSLDDKVSFNKQEEEKEKEEDKEKEKGGKINARSTKYNPKYEHANFYKEEDENIYQKPTEEELERVRRLFNE